MRQRTIGVAMLGAGFIAEYHLAGLAAAGGADVRVVVGRTPARAHALAQRFGVAESSADVAAALRRDDVQAVIIATPDDTHESLARDAAAAGKAILLQKPMADSVAAAERIVAGGPQPRRRPAGELHAPLLRRGRAGPPLAGRRRHRQSPGSACAQRDARSRLGCVVLSQATASPMASSRSSACTASTSSLQLLGRVRSVSARAHIALPQRRLKDGTTVQVETVDNAVALYELESGSVVTHEMSMTEAAGCDRFRMEIYGTQGTMWLRSERGRLAVFAPERFGAAWHAVPISETPFGQRQHEAWLAGIHDPAERLDTAADALQGMRIVDAVMRSSAVRGAAVEVEA